MHQADVRGVRLNLKSKGSVLAIDAVQRKRVLVDNPARLYDFK